MTLPHRPAVRHRRPRACGSASFALALWLGVGPAAAAPAAGAVSDCHYVAEYAGGTLERRAHVGEVDRAAVPALMRLLNRGPHDIRASFDRLEPRVLQRGQSEPPHGRLDRPVALLSVECLPARAAAAGGATPSSTRSPSSAVHRVAAAPPTLPGVQP